MVCMYYQFLPLLSYARYGDMSVLYGALNCMSSIDLDILFLSLSDMPRYYGL